MSIDRRELAELRKRVKGNPKAVSDLLDLPELTALSRGRRLLTIKMIDACLGEMAEPREVKPLTKRQKSNLKNAHKYEKLHSHVSSAYGMKLLPVNRGAASMMFSGNTEKGVVRKRQGR